MALRTRPLQAYCIYTSVVLHQTIHLLWKCCDSAGTQHVYWSSWRTLRGRVASKSAAFQFWTNNPYHHNVCVSMYVLCLGVCLLGAAVSGNWAGSGAREVERHLGQDQSYAAYREQNGEQGESVCGQPAPNPGCIKGSVFSQPAPNPGSQNGSVALLSCLCVGLYTTGLFSLNVNWQSCHSSWIMAFSGHGWLLDSTAVMWPKVPSGLWGW